MQLHVFDLMNSIPLPQNNSPLSQDRPRSGAVDQAVPFRKDSREEVWWKSPCSCRHDTSCRCDSSAACALSLRVATERSLIDLTVRHRDPAVRGAPCAARDGRSVQPQQRVEQGLDEFVVTTRLQHHKK